MPRHLVVTEAAATVLRRPVVMGVAVTAPLHPAVMGVEVAVDAPRLRVAEGSAGAEVVPMVVAEATAEEEEAAAAGDTRRPDPALPVTTTKESEGLSERKPGTTAYGAKRRI